MFPLPRYGENHRIWSCPAFSENVTPSSRNFQPNLQSEITSTYSDWRLFAPS